MENQPQPDNNNESPSSSVSPSPPKQSLTLMKKGDYSVHILLEEIKNVRSKHPDKLPFPVVKLTCFNRSQRSEKPETGCESHIFDDHFYFEQTNLSVEQLDSSKITIEAYDSESASKRADYYGIYEFDLAYIYNQPNHALHNFWLALANPESDDLTKVRGFLKLSISVLHDNDARIELQIKDNSSNCMVPSQIKMEYEMVSLHIFKAEELPDMDSLFRTKKVDRECDGFIEVKYLGITKKTSVVKMQKDMIIWNQVIDIPVSVPAVSQKIILTIKDYDSASHDDLIGSIELNIHDIVDLNMYEDFQYFNIYGSPLNSDSKMCTLMNNNAEIGSKWKGRILMKITHAPSDNPAPKVSTITDKELLNNAYNLSRSNLWSIYVKVYNAFYLPTKSDKYSIKVTVQDNEAMFTAKKAINNSIEWKQFKTLQCQTLTAKKDEVPDMFIYLLNDKGEPICFQRIKASDFHLNADIMIIKLIPDPCYDKVSKLYKSGIVKVKITMVNKAIDPPEKLTMLDKYKEGDTDDESNGDDLEAALAGPSDGLGIGHALKEVYCVVCCVYMSRYIVSGDSKGTSDPYISIQCIDNEQKTSIKYDTVNGIWNEKLIFDSVEMDLKNKATWPIMLLKVHDYDKLSSDELLGYSYVWLSDMNYRMNSSELVKPKWQQLFLPQSNRPQGEILLSFYILDNEHRHLAYEIDSIPKTKPYSFEINILGLRDLKPLSLLPVKKAFIKFDMNSLNVTGRKEDTLQSISTQPKDCGENPTINTVIKFDVKLPEEEIFMPELQCEVYDHLLSGMLNPMMGVFLLNVNRLIKTTHRQIDQDMALTKKKIGLFLTQGLIGKKLNMFALNEGEGGDKQQQQQQQQGEEEEENKQQQEDELIDTSSKQQDEPQIQDDQQQQQQHLLPQGNLFIPKDIALHIPLTKKTKIAKFKYSNDIIQQNKNNSEYFVMLPQYKTFYIPGTKPGTPNYKEYKIEDTEKAPSDTDYFSLGYIYKQEKQENEDGKLSDIDLSQHENITKHYRRIFKRPLEMVRELHLKPPFNVSFLRRGVEEDKADENGIFAALADTNNKIIKRYTPKELNTMETYEERERRERKEKMQNIKEMMQKEKEDENDMNAASAIIPKFFRNKGYGKFKGVIRICEKQKMLAYEKMINEYKAKDPEMIQELKNLNKYEKLTRNILVRCPVVIRVYILELRDLAKKDITGASDPYVKIYLGNTLKYDEQKNHVKSQLNVQWYKHYDIVSELPGESSLKIEVWDYDMIFKDELIGSTVIDLEDRFFCDNWKELKYKPIEVRPLRNPDKTNLQGNIYLWLDIFEKKDRINIEPWHIEPEPETKVEMRLVIWETENMKQMDVEGTSDIYVNAFVDGKNKQSTDIHYRSQNGIGSFNWRIVLPISLPSNRTVLYLQVYDNDLFASDDYICGAEIDLKQILKIPKDLDVPITFNKQYYDSLSPSENALYSGIEFMSKDEDETQTKFWVQCYKNNQKEGRVLCSLELLPQWKAEICKVGVGRSEPNVAPYLPPPVGRFEFSLNPFKNLNQCVGPRYRKKIYCGCCMVCLVVYLVLIIPYIVLHLTGEVFNPFNY